MKRFVNTLLVIATIALNVITLQGQDKTVIQVKALDETLNPIPSIELRINELDFFTIGKNGIAVIEVPLQDLPPRTISCKDASWEAASWVYSKGVLEVAVRKRNYRILRIVVQNVHRAAITSTEITYSGKTLIRKKTSSTGVAELPIPLDESLTHANQISVKDHTIVQFMKSEHEVSLVVQPTQEATPAASNQLTKVASSLPIKFNSSLLDTATSLRGLMAIVKHYPLSDLPLDARRKIDSKFESLMHQLEQGQNQNSYLPNISEHTDVSNDIRSLLNHVQSETKVLNNLYDDINIKIKLINDKLEGGVSNMSTETRAQLVKDILTLEDVLIQNASRFNQRHQELLRSIQELKSHFAELQELKHKLQRSEEQRLEEQQRFHARLAKITIFTLIMSGFIFVLLYLTRKLKHQRQLLLAANTEVKQMNDNLENMVKERTVSLESANRELDFFLYRSSHDLRGPVCSILGLCNLAGTMPPQELPFLLEKIARTASRMDKISIKLRTLSEINKPSSPTLVNMQALCNSVLQRFDREITEKQIQVKTSVPEGVDIFSHSFLLDTILYTLIENAVVFATIKRHHTPRIVVEVSHNSGILEISVFDNGIGIPKSIVPRIWDMFFIGHVQSTGNGLGLYIVKKSVQSLNGTVQIETEENEYCRFVVRVPLRST